MPAPDTTPSSVCVYAPETIVTVTVERRNGADEVHFHAGGQGFWVARLLGRLGVTTTMCTAFGGEPGVVARALVELEPIEVRAAVDGSRTGAWVHDRRSGERRAIADVPAAELSRHIADELFSMTLTSGLESGLCVLTGAHRSRAVPPDHFARLAADLRANGATVIADVSCDDLTAVLDAGVDFCKVSEEDVVKTDRFSDLRDPLEVIQSLQRAGAANVVLTRGAEGVVAAIGDEYIEMRAPRLQEIDHRGAGDALTALLAAGRYWGLGWRESVRWGAAAGALSVIRRGLATASRNDIHRMAARVQETVLGTGEDSP